MNKQLFKIKIKIKGHKTGSVRLFKLDHNAWMLNQLVQLPTNALFQVDFVEHNTSLCLITIDHTNKLQIFAVRDLGSDSSDNVSLTSLVDHQIGTSQGGGLSFDVSKAAENL